ncbi:hypothetical protein HDV00_002831 [Rhizophlyctis rosea]|nr:hypothetical protein HDV00_002831 [Rhizophlyctis rosea]
MRCNAATTTTVMATIKAAKRAILSREAEASNSTTMTENATITPTPAANITTTSTVTTTPPTATPTTGPNIISIHPLPYYPAPTPLPPPPQSWIDMNNRGPGANITHYVQEFIARCREVEEAVKNKIVIPAPVSYMENHYRGLLPVVPKEVVLNVYPKAVVEYVSVKLQKEGRKRKCRKGY